MPGNDGQGSFPLLDQATTHDLAGLNNTAAPVLQNWVLGANAPADNPPFGQRSWLVAIAIAWIPSDPAPQPEPRNFAVQSGAAVAANPPFSTASIQQQIARSWETVPQPQRRNPAGISSVDNPPFSRRFPIDQIIRTWDPPQPPQPAGPKQRVSVDNPPFTRRREQFTGDAPPPLPQRQILLVPAQAAAAADNPPFGQRPWISTVLESWIPPDPIQQRYNKYPTSIIYRLQYAETPISGVSSANVSPPANVAAGGFYIVSLAWQAGTTVSSITSSLGNTLTPFTGHPLSNTGFVQCWWAKNITGGAETITVNFSAATNGDLAISEYFGLNTISPLDGFPSGGGNTGSTGQTAPMDSGSYTTLNANCLIFGAGCVPSDFGDLRTKGNSFSEITNFRLLTEDKVVAVTGSYSADGTLLYDGPWAMAMGAFTNSNTSANPDNPPFGERDSLTGILRAWEPPPPTQQRQIQLVPIVAASADNPPFARRYPIESIVRAWDPIVPVQRQIPTQVISGAAGAANPPFGARADLWRIVGSWESTPQVQRSLPGQIVSVDDPPFARRNSLEIILRSWEPFVPAQRNNPSRVVSVDNPSFDGRDNLSPILRAWDHAAPIQQRRNFYSAGTPSVVNNPPFGSRTHLPAIIQIWNPVLPLPQLQRQGSFIGLLVLSYVIDRDVFVTLDAIVEIPVTLDAAIDVPVTLDAISDVSI